AYHDRSDGGLLVTLLEMAFAARVGLDIELQDGDVLAQLFTEELGAVIQIRDEDVTHVERLLGGLPWSEIARIRDDELIDIRQAGTSVYCAQRAQLQTLWAETSYRMQRLRDNPICADEEFAIVAEDDPGFHSVLSYDCDHDITAEFSIHADRPRIAVLREQGVNGQIEMAAAFERAGFTPVDVHMNDIILGRVSLMDFPMLVACGGFSYGDVLGAGGGWAKSILFHELVRESFQSFFAADRLALGVCNGCQMMAQLKELIPGAQNWPRFVRNRSEQFEGRTVLVKVNESSSPLLADMAGSVIPVAVAHGEGRAEFPTGESQDVFWNRNVDQVCLQYVDNHHEVTERYPANPNGADRGLAGLVAADGRVLAMMPHPERVYRAYQNAWRDENWVDAGPWLRLFRNARRVL
ncbi:MAG: phosphoribosylformylglycinamidine synthase subunit PurQ, partial [Gammaproteobacteria bacterium]|nr:phosphoribosylformylglycinamidine synthase subunit PurQ [Gammaproteobacteria bacterium]